MWCWNKRSSASSATRAFFAGAVPAFRSGASARGAAGTLAASATAKNCGAARCSPEAGTHITRRCTSTTCPPSSTTDRAPSLAAAHRLALSVSLRACHGHLPSLKYHTARCSSIRSLTFFVGQAWCHELAAASQCGRLAGRFERGATAHPRTAPSGVLNSDDWRVVVSVRARAF